MKKVVSVLLSILLVLQTAMALVPMTYAADVSSLQQRIDALPDASGLTLGQEPYRTEIISIYNDIYALPRDGTEPPDMTRLRDAAKVVLTIKEHCNVIPHDSSWRTYLEGKHFDAQVSAFKDEVKYLFRKIVDTPISERLSMSDGNYWNNLYNQLGRNTGFFSTQDYLDCFIPSTSEKISNMTASEISWYSYKSNGLENIVQVIWSQMEQDVRIRSDYSVFDADVALLRELSEKVLTLQQRANVLPHLYVWWDIEANADNPVKNAEVRAEVIYLYDRLFNKVPLSSGETMPNFGKYPDSPAYSVNLIASAQYLLTLDERIAYLPTVSELASFSEAQRNMVYNELNALYITINSLPADERPDMTKLYALTSELLTLENRCNRLPPRGQILEMTEEQKEPLRNEVRTLYAMIDALTDSDTQPSTAAYQRLREAASALLTLQERIDNLPTVEQLQNSGTKYNTYIYEESIVLRSLIDGLPPEATLPDDTKLIAIEEYFTPSEITLLHNEDELKTLLNEMNSSSVPLVKVAKLANSFETEHNLTLSKGTLTLLGDGYELKSYLFTLNNAATLNLGRKVYSPENDLTFVSNCNNRVSPDRAGCSLIEMYNTSILNICEGVTAGDSTARAYVGGIFATGSSIINMYNGTIRNCTNTSSTAGGIRLMSNSQFNMYNGLITDCYGYNGGGVQVCDYATFHMYNGTIQNCSSASNGGGAIALFSNYNCNFIMDGGTIQNCFTGASTHEDLFGGETYKPSAGNSIGGGIFIYHGNVTINGGEFIENQGNLGGAVGLYVGSLAINNVTMTGNKGTNGGAILLYSNTALTLNNSEFNENSATYGGGIYAYSGVTLNVLDTVFNKNEATSYGGGVYSSGGTATFTDCEFTENNASVRGGGLYINTAADTINGDTKFIGNTSASGGGICLYSTGSLTINGGEYAENIGNQLGGAVYALKGTVNINDGDFYQNQSLQGGAFSLAGVTFNMNGGNIFYNYARYGAGLYVGSNGIITLTDGLISQNQAIISNGMGGGIYTDGTVTVADGFKLYDNYAVVRGSDICALSTSKKTTIGTCCSEEMVGCHTVENWYKDASGARWSCYIKTGEEQNEIVSPGEYEGELNVVAGHGSRSISCVDAPGRILNQLATSESSYEIKQNGSYTEFADFEQSGSVWYIGASEELPAGTKFTLIYYPQGTEASGAEYYYYELSSDSDNISLDDFTRMGGTDSFTRTDTNDHFICQFCVEFPDTNTLDTVDIWLADTDLAQYFPNASAVTLTFDGGNIEAPVASLSAGTLHAEGKNLSITAQVSGLDKFSRVPCDPEHNLAAPINDYTAVLVAELLDADGSSVDYPKSACVTVGGVNVTASGSLAVVDIAANGDYDIEIQNLPTDTYKLKIYVCAVDNSVIERPMARILSSVETDAAALSAVKSSVKAVLSTNASDRIISEAALTADKTLSFNVTYITADSSQEPSVVSYVKQSGAYVETAAQWAWTASNKTASTQDIDVTVPAGTPAGTYRITFIVDGAQYNYNIIITE